VAMARCGRRTDGWIVDWTASYETFTCRDKRSMSTGIHRVCGLGGGGR
jgi:hypothetical protein